MQPVLMTIMQCLRPSRMVTLCLHLPHHHLQLSHHHQQVVPPPPPIEPTRVIPPLPTKSRNPPSLSPPLTQTTTMMNSRPHSTTMSILPTPVLSYWLSPTHTSQPASQRMATSCSDCTILFSLRAEGITAQEGRVCLVGRWVVSRPDWVVVWVVWEVIEEWVVVVASDREPGPTTNKPAPPTPHIHPKVRLSPQRTHHYRSPHSPLEELVASLRA